MGSYTCTSNIDNPLFDCSANNNSYYGWNTSSISMIASFSSLFQSMNVIVIYLMSSSSNASVPTLLQYLTSRDGMDESFRFSQDNLPTNLPEGPYRRNFTLSPGTLFNDILITIFHNNPFEWVAISRIIFCAATSEDHNVTFSSVMSTGTSVTAPTHVSSTLSAAVSLATPSAMPDTTSPTAPSITSTSVSSTLAAAVSSTVPTMSPTVPTTMRPANTTAGGPLSNSANNSGSVGVIIGAAVGALLLIIAILLLVVMLLCGRRRQSKIDDKIVTIKMNSEQPTPNTASKSVNVDQGSRLERVNELYIPSEVGCLDHNKSIPSVAGCDVTVTPNPSYAVSPNLLQTSKKSEKQSDHIQPNDELVQYDELGYLQLVGSATSDGVYDVIIEDTGGDNVNIDLNPSYSVSQEDGQDVELEDNPSYDTLQ